MMTEREQEIFMKGVAVGIKAGQEIENYLPKSVAKLASELTAPTVKKVRKTRKSKGYATWKPEDDEVLKELYGKVPVKVVAAKLGRTPTSVQSRAFNLHLSRKKDNSVREDREGLADLNQDLEQ